MLALLLAGCTQGPSRPERQPPPPVEAGARASKAEQDVVLTAEKLDAFVGYQQRMAQLYGETARELARLEGQRRPDGGKGGALAVFQAKAADEEEARTKAHLTEADVERFEEVVWAVIAKRTAAQALSLDEVLAQLERVKQGASADQQPALEKAAERLRAQRDELFRLTAERSRFGDAAVDLVLTREGELTRTWQAMLDVSEPKRSPRRRRDGG